MELSVFGALRIYLKAVIHRKPSSIQACSTFPRIPFQSTSSLFFPWYFRRMPGCRSDIQKVKKKCIRQQLTISLLKKKSDVWWNILDGNKPGRALINWIKSYLAIFSEWMCSLGSYTDLMKVLKAALWGLMHKGTRLPCWCSVIKRWMSSETQRESRSLKCPWQKIEHLSCGRKARVMQTVTFALPDGVHALLIVVAERVIGGRLEVPGVHPTAGHRITALTHAGVVPQTTLI